MIPRDKVLDMIVNMNAPYVRVLDASKNLLFVVEESDQAETTKTRLQEWLPLYESYGRVYIHAATAKQKVANYSGCYKWECRLTDAPIHRTNGPAPIAPAASFATQLKETLEVIALIQGLNGGNNAGNQALEIKKLELEHEKFKYQQDKEDPRQYIGGAMPVLGKFLGWKPEETRALMQDMAIGSSGAQASRISGPALTTDTNTAPGKIYTLEEAQQMTPEQQTDVIAQVLGRMPEKTNGADAVVFFSLLDNKPELMKRAIELHKSGII